MKYFSRECIGFPNDPDIRSRCRCCDDEETVKYAIASGTTLMSCNDPRQALKIIRQIAE